MFQGGKADFEKNREVFENIGKLDFVVLTHAHMDHSGRLPLLVKNGYNGPIYTTKLTGLQTREMLLDSVKIMKNELDKAKKANKKISEKFKKAKFLVKNYEKLASNTLSKEDREKIKIKIFKKYGDIDQNELEIEYLQAKGFLEKYNIENFLKEEPCLLFDEVDVEKTFSLFKFIDYGEEVTLKGSFSNLDEILASKLYSSKKDIFLNSDIFKKVTLELKEKIEKTKQVLVENENISKRNKSIKTKFESALKFVNQNKYYKNLESNLASRLASYKNLLENNNISDFSDIDDSLEPFYEIPNSLEDLQDLLGRIKLLPKESQESSLIKSIKLRFFDAGHIEGSSQVLISIISQNSSKVSSILNFGKDFSGFSRSRDKQTNLLFSGDLGRIKNPNISGTPSQVSNALDYLQVESTYAGKSHPERKQVEKRFFEEIENFHGKILIPAFSIQRTQEILLMILEKAKEQIGDLEKLKKLKEELKELENKYDSFDSVDKYLHKAVQISDDINILKKQISDLKKTSIAFQEIIVDSPLSENITNIYKNNSEISSKYKLLEPSEQIRLFGKEIIHFIKGKKEQEKIYSEKRKDKKEIIISASGMCEGGCVLTHLQNILENPKAKIIFVGYCPENTNGGKIKARQKVFIEGKNFEVKCEIADLPGFSAHIDGQEILQYLQNLNFKESGKIALTHGGNSRNLLSDDIQSNIDITRKSIEIIIPDLGDEIQI
ncbi:MBL fold metallo-hydrolase [Candidatus Gracilibacteria bacterium]|nr:MBL fold metallo-hydrolase [Candidatus Gracilibacteria bacterium]